MVGLCCFKLEDPKDLEWHRIQHLQSDSIKACFTTLVSIQSKPISIDSEMVKCHDGIDGSFQVLKIIVVIIFQGERFFFGVQC